MSQHVERCAIYTRQSRTNEGAMSSCEAQRQICKDTAESFSWQVVDVFEDRGKSSESLMRPEMQRLIAGIEEKQFDRVIAYSIDRLTRRLYDLAKLLELLDRGSVALTVVTDPNFGDSAASRFTTNIVAAAAEFQQELTKERMAESRAALKSQGRRVAGRTPFGYAGDRITKQLEVVPAEAALVRDCFQLAADGKTPAQISDLINESQLAEDQNWNPRRLLQILSNPVYAGFLPGDPDREGIHEAIVPPEQFKKVREHLENRRKGEPKKRESKVDYFPLRGLLYCAKCGRALNPNTSSRKNIRYRWYQCRSHAGGRPPCHGVSVNAWDMEEFVAEQIGKWEDSPEVARVFRDEWPEMVMQKRQELLNRFVVKITFNDDDGDVDIEMNDEAVARFVKEQAPDDGQSEP